MHIQVLAHCVATVRENQIKNTFARKSSLCLDMCNVKLTPIVYLSNRHYCRKRFESSVCDYSFTRSCAKWLWNSLLRNSRDLSIKEFPEEGFDQIIRGVELVGKKDDALFRVFQASFRVLGVRSGAIHLHEHLKDWRHIACCRRKVGNVMEFLRNELVGMLFIIHRSDFRRRVGLLKGIVARNGSLCTIHVGGSLQRGFSGLAILEEFEERVFGFPGLFLQSEEHCLLIDNLIDCGLQLGAFGIVVERPSKWCPTSVAA
jgi:hypothetical protein